MGPFGFQTRELNAFQKAIYSHKQSLAIGEINGCKGKIVLQIFIFWKFGCNLFKPSVDIPAILISQIVGFSKNDKYGHIGHPALGSNALKRTTELYFRPFPTDPKSLLKSAVSIFSATG